MGQFVIDVVIAVITITVIAFVMGVIFGGL
jgi:hypothetical protein